MDFKIAKTVHAGMFRYTLSEAGMHIEKPLPGLRWGTGPKGNHIKIGSRHVHYREVIGHRAPQAQVPENIVVSASEHAPALREIESASVSSMTDSSTQDLLRQINENRAKFGLAWLVLLLGGGGVFLAQQQIPLMWSAPIVFIAFLVARLWDAQRKTTVLMFEFEDENEILFKRVHGAVTSLSKAYGLWHIEATGRVASKDRKYQAGAGHLSAGSQFKSHLVRQSSS